MWLSLNVHLHVLALDGAYTFAGERPRLHRGPPPPAEVLGRLLETLIWRITRTLVRSGAREVETHDDGTQPYLALDEEGEDALTQLTRRSIRCRIAVGPVAGRETLRLHTPRASREGQDQPKPFTPARDRFWRNAAVAWPGPTSGGQAGRVVAREPTRARAAPAAAQGARSLTSTPGGGLTATLGSVPARYGTSTVRDTGSAWSGGARAAGAAGVAPSGGASRRMTVS